MSADIREGFWLGPWKVEPQRGVITGANGDTHHLGLKVMEVLVCLAQHANRTVSRDQLLKKVWAGNGSADDLLTGTVSDLRRVLQDDSGDPKFIETIPKRGYRLIGNIRLTGGSELYSKQFRSLFLTQIYQHKLTLIIVIVLVLGLIYIGYM